MFLLVNHINNFQMHNNHQQYIYDYLILPNDSGILLNHIVTI